MQETETEVKRVLSQLPSLHPTVAAASILLWKWGNEERFSFREPGIFVKAGSVKDYWIVTNLYGMRQAAGQAWPSRIEGTQIPRSRTPFSTTQSKPQEPTLESPPRTLVLDTMFTSNHATDDESRKLKNPPVWDGPLDQGLHPATAGSSRSDFEYNDLHSAWVNNDGSFDWSKLGNASTFGYDPYQFLPEPDLSLSLPTVTPPLSSNTNTHTGSNSSDAPTTLAFNFDSGPMLDLQDDPQVFMAQFLQLQGTVQSQGVTELSHSESSRTAAAASPDRPSGIRVGENIEDSAGQVDGSPGRCVKEGRNEAKPLDRVSPMPDSDTQQTFQIQAGYTWMPRSVVPLPKEEPPPKLLRDATLEVTWIVVSENTPFSAVTADGRDANILDQTKKRTSSGSLPLKTADFIPKRGKTENMTSLDMTPPTLASYFLRCLHQGDPIAFPMHPASEQLSGKSFLTKQKAFALLLGPSLSCLCHDRRGLSKDIFARIFQVWNLHSLVRYMA